MALGNRDYLSSSFFTSMGDAATSAVISLLRGLVMISVGIVLYPILFGNHGIWLVIPAAELVTLACCYFLVRKRLKALAGLTPSGC